MIHLVTTAVGAENHYTKANNAARRETPTQAAELDSKVLQAYIGHCRLAIVDNRTDFGQKMDRTLQHVFDLVGVESEKRIIYKRFQIKNDAPKHHSYEHRLLPVNSRQLIHTYFHDQVFHSFKFPHSLHYADITIEKFFLEKEEHDVDRMLPINANIPDRSYIYRRGQAGSYLYFLRKAGSRKPSVISVTEFLSYMERMDKCMAVLHERVRYFIYEYQYFALIDVGGEQFLEVGVDSLLETTLKLPPFITDSNTLKVAQESKWETFDSWLAYNLNNK